jgi:hypothetical protein
MPKTMQGGVIMPRRDGTGPTGQGSMTGRGLGVCSGVNAPLYGYGQGMGQARRAGMGCRRLGSFRGPVGYSNEELVAQKKKLQRELDLIESKIKDSSDTK